MNPGLKHLLDLRNESEKRAKEYLASARASRLLEEEEQARRRRRREESRAALAEEGRRQVGGGGGRLVTAGRVASSAAYLARLRARAEHLAGLAETHLRETLAAAKRSEAAAQAAYNEARSAREAVEELLAREEDKRRRIAFRRAEDAANDLAQAATPRQGRGRE